MKQKLLLLPFLAILLLTPTLVKANNIINNETAVLEALMPNASFAMAPPRGCSLPANVFFTNLSTSADTYVWDFGDATPVSTDVNPVHTYTSVGTFTITLIATEISSGLTDIATQQITITDTTTDFSGTPVFGCAPLQVDFTDNSFVNGGAVINWDWVFGDGGTSNAQNPSYIYDLPGLYTVTLTVTTDNGCQNTLTRNNYVTAVGPLPEFSANPVTGNAPLTVDFTDDTVYMSNGVSWLWDFGNGDTSTEQNPTYTYTSGCGEFDVSLTVTDQNGCTRDIVKPAFIILTDNMLNVECPEDFEVSANDDCMFTVGDYSGSIEVVGNCSEYTYTQDPPEGTELEAGVIPIIIIVSDGVNSATCQFNITVTDQTPPDLTCPGNQFEDFNENCEFVIPDYTPDVTVEDNCDDMLTITQNPPEGTIITAMTTVTFSSTDLAGNTGSCSFNVIPNDAIDPEMTCPPTQNETADINCVFQLPDYTLITEASDNCGTPVLTQSPAPGTSVGTGTTPVTITATDGINTINCTFNVNVVNGNILTVHCPSDQEEVVNENCEFTVPDYTIMASFSGNCGAATLTQNPNPGTIVSAGNYTVTITATDGAGSEDCQFLMTVADEIPPTIQCPENQVESANGNCVFSLPDYTNAAVTSDNCGVTNITQTPPPGTPLAVGNSTITLTASDGFNETSCSFTIEVEDTTPPQLFCLDDLEANADDNCLYVIPDYISQIDYFDNCNDNPLITQDPPEGTEVSIGDTTITITASDGINESECQFTVSVVDATAPELSCPENQTVNADENCSYTVEDFTGLVVTSDGCTTPTVSQIPEQGTVLSFGEHIITMISSDGINSSQCEFVVSVEDVTAPTIVCPEDQIESTNANCVFIIPDYSNLAEISDNCSITSITQTPEIGTEVFIGDTTITITVSDGFNETSCSFNVEVQDNTAPELFCLEDQVVDANSNCQFYIPNYLSQINYFDNCNNNPTVTQDPIAGTQVTAGETMITITATDGINESQCQFTITVIDVNAPTLSCPENQTVGINDNCSYVVEDFTGLAITSDGCSTPTVTQSPVVGTILEVGSYTVTLTSSDGANTSQCQYTLFVEDDIPPTINCANIVVQLDENGFAEISADDINAGSGDNCGVASTSIDIPVLDCSHLGETIVTLTVTDLNGNQASCESTITVLSNANPMAVCQNVTVVLDENGIGTLEGIDLDGGSTGGCIFTASITEFSCEDIGEPIPVTMTLSNTDDPATDSCTAMVHVVDPLSPVISCPSEMLIVAALDPYELPDFSTTGEITVTDNCANQITYLQVPEPGTLVGAGETEITITATDPSDNEASCSFMIFVDPSLGTDTITIEDTLSLFPNPAEDQITISNPEHYHIKSINIIDIRGRIVKNSTVNNNLETVTLHISEIASATYFVSIVTDNGNKMIQLIKK